MRRVPSFLVLLALAAVGASPAAATTVPTCFGLPATIWGQSGAIVGTAGVDVVVGSGGSDTIRALGGDDVVWGGDGNDLLFGEQGSDAIHGEHGDDTLFGDADDGSVFAAPSTIIRWDGYSPGFGACGTSQSGFGDDRLTGSSGDDTLADVGGDNTADGGGGADRIDASGTARGGSGDDIAVWAYDGLYDGGDCAGYADGGSGRDAYVYVHGGVAKGGSGNDAVFAEHTGSVAEGGSGRDVVGDYSDSYADIGQPFFHDAVGAVTLNGGSAQDVCNSAGDDTLISCETLV